MIDEIFEITWVGPFCKGRKKGHHYRVIALKSKSYPQAKAFLDPEHRNYKHWEPLLHEGNLIKGLVWKDKSKNLITGDSPVELV